MAREYDKTVGCSDANEILRKWLDRRKETRDAEEKIITSILSDEQLSCIPHLAKQLKDIFDTDIDSVIKEAIKMQIERDRPHEVQIPEPPAGEMRGKVEVMKTASSNEELAWKLKDAIDTINKVYDNQPDMQGLWMKRVNATRKDIEEKIKRMKNRE